MKNKHYEITIVRKIPYVVNVESNSLKQAESLALNLIEDMTDWDSLKKVNKVFESGEVDQYGEIETKVIKVQN